MKIHPPVGRKSCSLRILRTVVRRVLRRRRKVGNRRCHAVRLIERYEGRRIGYAHQFRAAHFLGQSFGLGDREVAFAGGPGEQEGESEPRSFSAAASVKRLFIPR